jgi:hypothetical protein
LAQTFEDGRHDMAGGDRPADPGDASIAENLRGRLHALLYAWTCAHDAAIDLWNFALRIDRLHNAGLTITDLRWLVAREFVCHAEETTNYGDEQRSFLPGAGYFFTPATAFVLTERGRLFAQNGTDRALTRSVAATAGDAIHLFDEASANGTAADGSHSRPRWDALRRELSLDEVVIKRFRVPAPNQECILAAFQEEGWPDYIDDPLPKSNGTDPKARLHDAINRLNGRRAGNLIRFHGNGKGNGIGWRAVDRG